MISSLPRLSTASAAFHSFPSKGTALLYQDVAIRYYDAMIIPLAELENILWLVCTFLEANR